MSVTPEKFGGDTGSTISRSGQLRGDVTIFSASGISSLDSFLPLNTCFIGGRKGGGNGQMSLPLPRKETERLPVAAYKAALPGWPAPKKLPVGTTWSENNHVYTIIEVEGIRRKVYAQVKQ